MNVKIPCIPILCVLCVQTVQGAISLSAPTPQWVSLGANFDFLADQQTGSPAGDIVGDSANPGFLTSFDPISGASNKDGILSFRVRLDAAGGTQQNPQFDRVLWVGMDADLNGSVDVFMGVDRSGSNSTLGIYAPGLGANVSPSTTSISSTASYSEPLSGLNFDYRQVAASDGGTSIDLTAASSGDVDWYVSFQVPFSSVTAFLDGPGVGINITDSSPVRFILATSTQANSLNQDLGGIQGSIKSTSTWQTLGGFTPTTPVPEPAAGALMTLAALTFGRRGRFTNKRSGH